MTGQSKDAEIEAKEKKQLSVLWFSAVIGSTATTVHIPAATALVLALKNGDAVAAAKTMGLMGTCGTVMELFLNPIVGQLSDKYGRKPFMMMSLSLIAVVQGLVAVFPRIEIMFLNSTFAGPMLFSFVNSFQAAVADLFASKSIEKMAVAFSQMGAASAIGTALGPLLGSRLAGRKAYGVSALGFAAATLWIWHQLEETHSTDKHKKLDLLANHPLSFVKLFKNRTMAKLASTLALESFADMPSLIAHHYLYLNMVLGYGQQEFGMFVTGFSITQFLGAIQVNKIITSLGQSTYTRIGDLAYIIGLGIMSSAKSTRHLALSLFFCMLGHQRGLEATSLLATHGAAAGLGYGELEGAKANLLGVAKLVAPLLYSKVFSWAMSGGRNMPGLPYLLAPCIIAVSHLLFSTVSKEVPVKKE